MSTVNLGVLAPVKWSPGASGLTATLTVTAPDGTISTPAVTEESGAYSANVPTPLPGRYLIRWTAPDRAYTDVLDVWPADPRYILSLEDVRTITGVQDPSHDDLLRLMSCAATVIIEDIVGAVLVRDVVQFADGGRTGVLLWERPVADTMVVKANGTTLVEESDYFVAVTRGIVYAGSRQAPSVFPSGMQNLELTYKTGGVLAPNIALAAGELIKHLYSVGHQAVHADFSMMDDSEQMASTPSSYSVPNRVIELCAGTHKLAGLG